jgi:hypothetical protein
LPELIGNLIPVDLSVACVSKNWPENQIVKYTSSNPCDGGKIMSPSYQN